MERCAVLIVGAGPTGLTLAIELARRGVTFRLVDAAERPFAGSRGKGLQPRTLEILEDLGVIEAVLAAGGLYPRLRVHLGPLSWRMGSLGSAKAATEAVPYPNLWMAPQSRTEEILRNRLAELGRRVEFGRGLAGFVQEPAGVRAEFLDGATMDCDFLVGCDGARSVVRKTLGLQLLGETLTEKTTLVGDVAVEGLDRSDWHVWPLATGGAVGLCPLPGTDVFQLTMPASSEEAAGQSAHMEEAVRKAAGLPITRVDWSSVYRPQVRMVERYRVGRVMLAGDAAHVHPPSGGQGLNTGVQDAYNLGWKLAHVVRGGPESLLDSYEAERLPIAAAVLGLTRRLHQTRSIKRGDATNQLALHYRQGPLSEGERWGDLAPGDRMPDARLADGSRLFQRMQGTHATEVVTRDGSRILVRPDGYVARIGAESTGQYAGEAVRVVEGFPV